MVFVRIKAKGARKIGFEAFLRGLEEVAVIRFPSVGISQPTETAHSSFASLSLRRPLILSRSRMRHWAIGCPPSV